MIITIVAFNLKQVNSTAYRKFQNIESASRFFKMLLERDDIDFMSIRKIKDDQSP